MSEKTSVKEKKDIVILWFWTEFNVTYKWKYRETMELLMNYGRENNIRFINSSVYHYNHKKWFFTDWWTYNGKKWEALKKIKPEKVLYKSNKVNHLTNHINEEFEFMNDLKLVLLANNKFDTARYFKSCSPLTWKLSDIESSKFNKNKLVKDEYIIKPINWSWWSGIMKVKKTELDNILSKFWYWKENVIIQEFLDMSCWVPWVVEWIHDLRYSVFWKRIFPHVYVRIPKEGDFRSNISAWWKDYFVDINKLPIECNNMAKKIVRDIYNIIWEWIYSIDIVNTTEWYKLMELNSSPWFLFKEKDIQKKYFQYIVNSLK